MKTTQQKKFQNFALHLLIQGELTIIDFSNLKKLNFEVNKIGNNINQITRLANQFSEISQEDIQLLQTECSHLTKLITKTLREETMKRR